MSEKGNFSYSLITGNYCLTQGEVTLDVDCGDFGAYCRGVP